MLQELEPVTRLDSQPPVEWPAAPAQAELPLTSVPYAVQARRDDDWLCAHVGRVMPDPFEILAARWRVRLQRYCTRRLRSAVEADDAVQEVLERVYRRLWRTDDVPQLRPFLFTTARNVCIDRLRAQQRRPECALENDCADLEWAGSERLQSREELEAVIRDMQALSERQRAALLLRELSGFSHHAIAERLGTSAARSKSLISEARQVLIERRVGRNLDCGSFLVQTAASKHPHLSHRLRAHVESCVRCALPAPMCSFPMLLPVMLRWLRRRMRHALPLARAGAGAKTVAVLAVLGTTAGMTHMLVHRHRATRAPGSARSASTGSSFKLRTSSRSSGTIEAKGAHAGKRNRVSLAVMSTTPSPAVSPNARVSMPRVSLPSGARERVPGRSPPPQPTATREPAGSQEPGRTVTGTIALTVHGPQGTLQGASPQPAQIIAVPPIPVPPPPAVPSVAAIDTATKAVQGLAHG